MKEIAPGITANPNVRHGKPVIKGTRVPVDLIVGQVAGGMTIEKICRQYDLKKTDVLAALKYAARILEEERIIYAR